MVVAARASGRRGFARRSRRNPGQSGGLQAAPAPYTDGHRVRGTGCLLPVARTCTAGRCEGYDRAPATRAGRWVDSRCAPDRRGETRSSRSAPHLARSRRMRAAVAMPASSGVRVPEVSQLREFTPTTATPRCGHATLREVLGGLRDQLLPTAVAAPKNGQRVPRSRRHLGNWQ